MDLRLAERRWLAPALFAVSGLAAVALAGLLFAAGQGRTSGRAEALPGATLAPVPPATVRVVVTAPPAVVVRVPVPAQRALVVRVVVPAAPPTPSPGGTPRLGSSIAPCAAPAPLCSGGGQGRASAVRPGSQVRPAGRPGADPDLVPAGRLVPGQDVRRAGVAAGRRP